MPKSPISRTSDPTIPFAAFATLGATNVRVGGQPVTLANSPLTPHGTPPKPGIMMQSSITVRANGQGIVRQGDVSSTGESATSGSPLVKAGD
tara:strand:+ start:1784 stop:2059 length:276 start_codon:yes stop_codon:yes gene_type:complete